MSKLSEDERAVLRVLTEARTPPSFSVIVAAMDAREQWGMGGYRRVDRTLQKLRRKGFARAVRGKGSGGVHRWILGAPADV